MEMIMVALLAIVILLQIIGIVKGKNSKDREKVQNHLNEIKKDQQELRVAVIKEISEGNGKNQATIRESLIQIQESTEKRLREDSSHVNESITKGLKSIQEVTDKKLSDIEHNMEEKLDKNLHTRLDESFKQVGERLESLYKSLGELKSLENGVTNLNKTLSNVKARGVYGEMALENLLANILDRNQYEVNVVTKPKSTERVEFAIKIPDKDNKGYLYLPIDSKFPADIYGKVLEAAENADVDNLKLAVGELKNRIRKEAMTIRDKYIAPPNTTDFAIMFLPTEGLYSEVLRIDGLVEECQEKYKIIISGPTTLTAILNSLSVGFKYLTVNKKSEEIMKTLGNFKIQFQKFNELISKTQNKISDAQKAAGDLMDRSNLIQKRLDKVEVVEYEELEIE